MMNDFEKFAVSKGIGTNKLNEYNKYAVKNGIINPTILEERSMNVIGLDIFSRLQYDRILFLGTGINDDVANIINAQLLYLNSTGDDDIKMFINSPGGSVIDGLAIYDIMNFITPDVSTYCLGMAASMGSILISSGTKGKRYSLPNGEIMIHQVSSWAEGQTADMEIRINHAKKLQTKLYEILASNTGKTFEQIEKDADRDHWFTAEEALEYGLIDEIITKQK
jgi:ATP-dependent Clp protease protease subunit